MTTIHTFDTIYIHGKAPLRKRLQSRKYCGPYQWSPTEVGKGRGFYSSSADALVMGDGPISLRLEYANDHIRSRVTGYYCDRDGDGDTLKPVIARLPHGRGFLAGWTMGAGMCGAVDGSIYDDESSAAYAAHSLAEYDAERSCDAEECGDVIDDDETDEDEV